MGATFLDLASVIGKRRGSDVCQATIIHEDYPDIESFYHEHYDQKVVMRLLYPPTSSSEKHTSWSVLLCLNGGILWTLFTRL